MNGHITVKLIERNTLTLREIQIVLEGITVGGKSIKEHLETINHEKATLLHSKLVKIYPFIKGNGRTSRLIMNLDLMNHGYNPVIVKKKIDKNIMKALDKAHTTRDYKDFIKLITKLEIKMLKNLELL